MYANFTEETATGTGVTLALAGATTGNIGFVKSFADGDLVAYVVEDSGGVIKVAGVGTYVSATDDITRNDTWNYSSGGVVDDNPTTNIALSAGTHTVRCDVIGTQFDAQIGVPKNTHMVSGHFDSDNSNVTRDLAAGIIYYIPFLNNTGAAISTSSIGMDISTAGTAAARVRLGFATARDGDPSKLLFQTAEIDASTTGGKTASVTGLIPCGWSFSVLTANEALTFGATTRSSGTGSNPLLGSTGGGSSQYSHQYATVTSAYGVIPSPPPASTGTADLVNIPTITVQPL